jgi:hypothetical protein
VLGLLILRVKEPFLERQAALAMIISYYAGSSTDHIKLGSSHL